MRKLTISPVPVILLFLKMVIWLTDMETALAVLTLVLSAASILFTNKSNKNLMEEQQQYNTDMWNKQNAYNTPAEQIKRLQEAGINPNSQLMSSGSQITGNTSGTSLPMSLLPMIDPMSSISNNMLQLASAKKSSAEAVSEKSLRQARIDNIVEQNNKLRAETDSLGLSNTAQSILNKYLDSKETLAIRGMRSDLKLKAYQRSIMNNELKTAEYNLYHILPEEWQKLVNENKINVLELDRLSNVILDTAKSAELKEAQTALADSEQKLTEEKIATEKANQKNIAAGTQLTEEQIKYYGDNMNKLFEKYDSEIREAAARAGLTEEQAEWYVIDKINDMSINILGVKVPAARFGPNNIRHATNRQVRKSFNRYSDSDFDTYYSDKHYR